MFRRIVPVVVIVALVPVVLFLSADGGDDTSGHVSSSPALIVVQGIDGLPATVAELPNADADTFRALLGELRGTPVVVNLWASWCGPCEREMPMLAAAATDRPDVQFLGIDTLDSRDGADTFIAEHQVPFPSLFDPNGEIRTELDGIGLPITVFFDADGNQVAKVDGELSQDTLDENLRKIAS